MASNKWNAELYDTNHSFVAKYGETVLKMLAPKKGEHILDLGCGTGPLTAEIKKMGAEVVGIDSSKEMIDKAKEAYPDIVFTVEDGHCFKLDKSVDAIFSNAALHWMTEPEKVIACVFAALKPGGRFVFEMGGFGNIKNLLAAITTTEKEFGFKATPIQNYYPSIGEYASLLETQGFSVKHAELIDRFTKLDGEHGIRNWVKMFRKDVVEQIGTENEEAFYTRLEANSSQSLYKDNHWWADYVRLRMIAYK